MVQRLTIQGPSGTVWVWRVIGGTLEQGITGMASSVCLKNHGLPRGPCRVEHREGRNLLCHTENRS